MLRKKSKARKEQRWEDYKSLKREIRAKIRRDKTNWLEKECAKITIANAERKSKQFFQQIKMVKGASLKCKEEVRALITKRATH